VGGKTWPVTRTARGALVGVVAAALFGASAPISKRLLGSVRPQMLAGLLYAGAAIVLSLFMLRRRVGREARLRRSDRPTLGVITLAGGVVAPVLLMLGLVRVTGVAASLLLNLEAVFTLLLAVVIFGEYLSRIAAAGVALVIVAAGALAFDTRGGAHVDLIGIALVAAACALWGVDNNLTQRLTDRDPFAIVRVKATAGAVVNLAIAFALGAQLPPAGTLIGALALGAGAYGASIVLDAYALRWIGAAREAGYFATAPAFGIVASLVVLHERLTALSVVAIVVMAAGVVLLLTERHEHRHVHAALTHEHRHRHDDDHHDHVHDDVVVGAHSHPHQHEPLVHTHPHVSDSHHRHPHDG
jgi:drug/metabolite transporter (DMT)-like permease